MKVKMELDLKPFQVPNFVLAGRTVPGAEETKFALEDMDAETIETLCDQFVRDVYKKANKLRTSEVRAHFRCDDCGKKTNGNT